MIDQKKFCEKLGSLSLAKSFLGREYLTWLWWLAETRGHALEISSSESEQTWLVDLWIDDRILLQSWDLRGHENLLRGGDPSHSPEAAASLCDGKVVREIRLGLRVAAVGDYSCTLKSTTLSPSGLRLPCDHPGAAEQEGMDESATDAIISARLQYCDIFLEITDALFAWFMKERSADDWEERGLSQIRSWIAGRGKNSTGDWSALH
ncbi:MAG: hypothetical protein H6618_04260 [Deltaproteobacteria bacterium]|nr:hypothetical protein [Deltaproteobacteria bacterium]